MPAFMVKPFTLWLMLNTVSLLSPGQERPPLPKKVPVVFEEFSHKRVDDYYWMNDKKDPAVLEYIHQENAYSAAMLKPLEALQQVLLAEMSARQAKSFSSLPTKRNGYWYYERTDEGRSYPVYYRRQGNMQAKEELIQDANLLAGDSKALFFRQPVVSPDNRLAIISYNTRGDRRDSVRVKNLVTQQWLPDAISDKSFVPAIWARDNAHFFYVANDQAVRPSKLMLHTLGSPAEQDQEIWRENDSTFRISDMSSSRDKRYLLFHTIARLSSETYYVPLSAPHTAPVSVSPRQNDVSYRVIDCIDGYFYVLTNYKAPHFRVVKARFANSDKDQWQDVIPENAAVFIEPEIAIVNNEIVSRQKKNGITEINVHSLKRHSSYNIGFSQKAYSVFFSLPDDDVNSDDIRLHLSSYAFPATDYSYNLTGRNKAFIRQEEVNNFAVGDYETKVFQVTARDGQLIPVNMVFNRKAYRADGQHPLLLGTYSWYGYDFDLFFDSSLISLLDRGFAYVYVYARGGSGKGPDWWAAGRRLNRNSTFFDVVDVAQWLVDHKYAAKEKFTASGASAGGTNIGALVNLRPDLFRAVIADVPWLDVITDMKNPDIPLVTSEYEEEGNPGIEAEYNYMLTWSPYDNIKKASYPSILATSGWYDNNVPFYHAAKWVAKIREYNTGQSPVLLICNTESGHAGSSDRFERLRMTALKYSFLIDQVK